jgi:hypothetical protein
MRSPNACSHEDVLVGVELNAARWQGPSPDPDPLVQQGRCTTCGSQVMRRGRHDAWAPWRLEPPQRYRRHQYPYT